eukprot:COSAG02_NODE_894_length_16133_cov_5.336036_3_plen_58_part_00
MSRVRFSVLTLRLFFFFSGMMAIRDEREYVIQEDFMKAVRKMMEQKKLETKLDYQKP